MEEIEDLLKPALCDGQGKWTIDYVRLRFQARKPDGIHPAGADRTIRDIHDR